MGIEELPPQPLTDKEWQDVYLQFNERNDVEYGCSICCEDFKQKKQVILSCSHSFHHQCLSSFEKYSQTFCCPICRKIDYEKKIIFDGLEYWKQQCCILIQNGWRSFVCLKEYRLMQDTIEPTSPHQKERFHLRKFQKLNNNLISSVNARSNDIDDFLASINDSIANSRAVFDAIQNPDENNDEHKEESDEYKVTKSGELWIDIKKLALGRNEKECSICMDSLNKKKCVLLSCSHIFHSDCISSFEKFTLSRRATCPMCRNQDYEKIDLYLK